MNRLAAYATLDPQYLDENQQTAQNPELGLLLRFIENLKSNYRNPQQRPAWDAWLGARDADLPFSFNWIVDHLPNVEREAARAALRSQLDQIAAQPRRYMGRPVSSRKALVRQRELRTCNREWMRQKRMEP